MNINDKRTAWSGLRNSQYNDCQEQSNPPLSLSRTLILSSALLFTANAKSDVMLGASLPDDGFSRQVISDFNQVTPKPLAYVNIYSAFSHDWDHLYWQSGNVVAEGATPMISWMPVDLSRENDNLLPEIALGYWDDYLTQWGTKLLAWVNTYPESERPRLAIRFAHEFNGNWYPYSNMPTAYKAAWQNIHDLFTELGVNEHLDWIWSASKTNVDDYNDFTVYYPGDSYVDWTSLDGYNWGSNYSSDGWTSFTEIFSNSYNVMIENYPHKPIMISETASAEPQDLPNQDYGMYGNDSDALESKTVWIEDMLSDLETNFPAVRALSIFNINKEMNWSISTEINTGLDGWITGTQSNYYTSDLLIASTLDPYVAVSEEPSKDTDNDKDTSKCQKKKKNKRQAVATQTLQQQQSTELSARRNISSEQQTQLSRTSKRIDTNRRRDKLLSDAMKKMSASDKAKFKRLKLSVINY